jgi:hypothetical protein
MVYLKIESDGELNQDEINCVCDIFQECIKQKQVMNDKQHGRMAAGWSDSLYRE